MKSANFRNTLAFVHCAGGRQGAPARFQTLSSAHLSHSAAKAHIEIMVIISTIDGFAARATANTLTFEIAAETDGAAIADFRRQLANVAGEIFTLGHDSLQTRTPSSFLRWVNNIP